MDNVIRKIRQELKENSDEKVKVSGQRFFKEKIKLYGVKSATAKRIGKENFKLIKNKSKDEVFALCETLWQSGFLEETYIASNWSYYMRKSFESKDFKLFESWIDAYVTNWASCDTFCNHAVGAFIEKYPEYIGHLKKWTRSKNVWKRRAAAVSLIVPARQGKFLSDIFEISDALLPDKEDLVQKGYGWLLKVSSQKHLQEVFSYVMDNKTKMPRTALRYAIEKMPDKLRAKAMER